MNKAELNALRYQYKVTLGFNSRKRAIILQESLHDYVNGTVDVVIGMVNKYFSKMLHDYPPTIILDSSKEAYHQIAYKLFTHGIKVHEGVIADFFSETHFYKAPVILKVSGNKPFQSYQVRLTNNLPAAGVYAFDEVFIFGKAKDYPVHPETSHTYRFDVDDFGEVQYLLGLL